MAICLESAQLGRPHRVSPTGRTVGFGLREFGRIFSIGPAYLRFGLLPVAKVRRRNLQDWSQSDVPRDATSLGDYSSLAPGPDISWRATRPASQILPPRTASCEL